MPPEPPSYFCFDTHNLNANVTTHQLKHIEQTQVKFELQCLPLPLHKQMAQKGLRQASHNDGDTILKNIEADLDRCVYNGKAIRRSNTQKLWHRHMLLALMRNIYGPHFNGSIKRIQAKFHVKEIRQEVLISAGRVGGKTWAVAMMLAVCLIHIPNIDVAVFASGLRLAEEMVLKIRTFVECHPNGAGRVITNHSSVLTLRVRGPKNSQQKDVRTVQALPGKQETVRGLHKKIIVVDEFTFSKGDLFMEAILPMTQQEYVTLIGISTPKGRNNIFSRLLTLMDTSKTPPRPMYNVILSGRVCDKCRAEKKAETCTHRDAEIPEWLDLERVGKTTQMLKGTLGNSALYLNEALGEMADMEAPAFASEDIDALFKNVARGTNASNSPVSCIYLACDTNGPGKCEMAFVGVADRCGRLEVCLLAATPGNQTGGISGDRIFTRRVFGALRARYPGTVIVFIPESNYAKEASHLQDYIVDMPHVVTMQELTDGEKTGYYGVPKDNLITFEMKNLMVRMMQENRIFIAANLIGIPPDKVARDMGLAPESEAAASYMLNVWRQQMNAMRYRKVKTRDGTKEEYRIDGKGMGMNDDLGVAGMMPWYWRQIFKTSLNKNYVAARHSMPLF